MTHRSSARRRGGQNDGSSMKPVALLSMPTVFAGYPSFQLSLLTSTLRRAGIPVEPLSLSIFFARIGLKLNDALAECLDGMPGEWIWSEAAFGHFADDQFYLQKFQSSLETVCIEAGCEIEGILHVRQQCVPAFLDYCLESINWGEFGAIGFSVVYQQMLASLALAKRLKERFRAIPIIFGGPAFEDDIADQIMRGSPFVDVVHCGDADLTFPELCHRLHKGEALTGLPGIMWRDGDHVVYNGRAPNLVDINLSPVPDFDEYFSSIQLSGMAAEIGPHGRAGLPFESARGCWWGAKNHCIFCGLNRAGINFRSRDPASVVDMLQSLSHKYGQKYFYAIDNIMDHRYLHDLFAQLATRGAELFLHYNLRPDVGRETLKTMRLAGLYSIQPGVESLCTRLLTLMNKHLLAVRTVELMKWCACYGIRNLYALLFGFRGETREDYAEQCELIGKIHHLQPPVGVARARADRGSPMFLHPNWYGVIDLRPAEAYPFLFPTDTFDLGRVAYFFDHSLEDALDDREYAPYIEAISDWMEAWIRDPRPSLTARKLDGQMVIEDGRSQEVTVHVLETARAELYEFCTDARSPKDIRRQFGEGERIQEWIEEFLDSNIMIRLDGRYLALAIPEQDRIPSIQEV